MNDERVSQFIIKLIKLTQKEEIKWISHAPRNPELLNGEFILDKIYETDIDNNKFQLFKIKYQVFTDEFDYVWERSIRLRLIDDKGNSEYGFRYDNSLNDLYSLVREKTSKIGSIIEEILKKNT